MTNRRRRRARHKAHKARARMGRVFLDLMMHHLVIEHELNWLKESKVVFIAQYARVCKL